MLFSLSRHPAIAKPDREGMFQLVLSRANYGKTAAHPPRKDRAAASRSLSCPRRLGPYPRRIGKCSIFSTPMFYTTKTFSAFGTCCLVHNHCTKRILNRKKLLRWRNETETRQICRDALTHTNLHSVCCYHVSLVWQLTLATMPDPFCSRFAGHVFIRVIVYFNPRSVLMRSSFQRQALRRA